MTKEEPVIVNLNLNVNEEGWTVSLLAYKSPADPGS